MSVFQFFSNVLLFITLASSLASSNLYAGSQSGDKCFEARKVVLVLKMQRPVYLDQKGNYRPQWVNDPYKGKRTYIEDDSRESHLTRAVKNLNKSCKKPDDPKEMKRAKISVVKESKCLAARADLVFFKNPETRSSKQKIRDQRRLVERYCAK